VLLYLYSPDLVSAQEEYIRALQGTNGPLAATARQRLLSWDVSRNVRGNARQSGKSSRRVRSPRPFRALLRRK